MYVWPNLSAEDGFIPSSFDEENARVQLSEDDRETFKWIVLYK